jgi:hypothetical protein
MEVLSTMIKSLKKHVDKIDPGLKKYAESIAETLEHRKEVQRSLNAIIKVLQQRGKVHDQSKLEEPELAIFAEWGPKLKEIVLYDSGAYRAALFKMRGALRHHYEVNPHHPEFVFSREEWKPVKDADSYEVSDLGRVRFVGEGFKEGVQPQVLPAGRTPIGYRYVQCVVQGVKWNFLVHRLVVEAFIDNPARRSEVQHKDGDKENNAAVNLEWTEGEEAVFEESKKMDVRYVVFCEELDLVTVGCKAMEKELRLKGYESADASWIWRCINEHGICHLNLKFCARIVEDFEEVSPIDKMNIIDLIEMLCDWVAASKRIKNGDFLKSLSYNKRRFGLSSQLMHIITNSIGQLGS